MVRSFECTRVRTASAITVLRSIIPELERGLSPTLKTHFYAIAHVFVLRLVPPLLVISLSLIQSCTGLSPRYVCQLVWVCFRIRPL